MLNGPANVVHTSAPVFHAIDQVTILTLELHRLRQFINTGRTIDLVRLDQMNAAISALGCDLVMMRDGVEQPGSHASFLAPAVHSYRSLMRRRRPPVERSTDGTHDSGRRR